MSTLDFATFTRGVTDADTNTEASTYAALPELQKKQLCLDLLAEFGADEIRENAKGELQHRCTLPFDGHTDRNSITASINYRKLKFHCFVCGNSGSLLWWIAVNRRESVTQSTSWLRDKSGVSSGLDTETLLQVLDSLFHPKVEERIIPSYSDRSIRRWLDWPRFHPYLTGRWLDGCREIPEDNLRRFTVGYCDHDDDWHYYQRIILPIRWGGQLVGWQARKLDPADPVPAKYKFSPDTPRDRILYGLPEALDQRDELLVVEGTLSAVRHAHHLPIAATMGASVSPLQLPLLHRYRRVYLMLDNDKAGWQALTGTFNRYGRQLQPGLIETLRPYTELFVVQNPFGSIEGRQETPEGPPDAADFTDSEIEMLVAEAVPAVRWRPPHPADLAPYCRAA